MFENIGVSPMSHYEYFLIFLSLAFCGYASYTDVKTQKIRNFCSLGLVYMGTLSQLVAWYLGTTTPLSILGLFFGGGLIAFALYWFWCFLAGGLQTLVGTLFNLSIIAFQKSEWCFEFSAVDTCLEYHYSLFDRDTGISDFQVCVDAQ